MEPKIVFEDEYLLAINKPSGMVVNRSETTRQGLTLQDWLAKKGIGLKVERNGIVHRLDKETSGVLIIAKNNQIMKRLQQQFKLRQVSKEYLCLVHGRVRPAEGTIKAPITRNPFNRKRFGVFVGGRAAQTDYKIVAEYRQSNKASLTLVRVKPKTGRTHQIRVHFKYLSHPVVADELYAGRKTARNDRVWCPRLFLHAQKLSLVHPVINSQMLIEAELPADLKAVLKKLKNDLF